MPIFRCSSVTLFMIISVNGIHNTTSTLKDFTNSDSTEVFYRQEPVGVTVSPVQEAISAFKESEGALEAFGNVLNLFSTLVKGFVDIPAKAIGLINPTNPTPPVSQSADVSAALISNQLTIQNYQQQQQIQQLMQKQLLEQLLGQYNQPHQQHLIQQVLQQPQQPSIVGNTLVAPQPIQIIAVAPTRPTTQRPTTERQTDPEDGEEDGDF